MIKVRQRKLEKDKSKRYNEFKKTEVFRIGAD